ncbi:MAG: nucleotidyltransferase domain-containing protein [Deltaproteobacteria bacterium]|nr:nucleotidyltransferase domain-containing protein [Deltaproteobacteria bacterium]
MEINISNSYSQRLKALNITIIYLFGSFAEDKTMPFSDIDIGILLTQEAMVDTGKNMGEIYNQVYDVLTDMFPSRNIDIVFLQKAPLELRFDVITHGRILYESSRDASLKFEEDTMILYADFKPLLKEINDTIINRA